MTTEKRALYCVFKPQNMPSTKDMRALYETSYPMFRDMDAVESKVWWCDQQRKEWGSFYVFKSEKHLNDFINSDHWQKVAIEKYGCTPSWTVLDVGCLISKEVITTFEGSWQSQ